jgi:iron complex transport system ATP-binding protein
MLELLDLHFHYPHKPAHEIIRGVSLQVGEGEIVALLGPNGSGKSTLLQLAAGWLRPTGGEVRYAGRSMAGLTRREIARFIACFAQSAEIRFPLTALEYVLTGRYAHVHALGFDSARDIEIARDALHETDTFQFADRPIGELSMGERQRVSIARAIAQEPRLLLLDEPTANADLAHQVSMLRLIRELAGRRGIAAVIVTHDLNLAAESADRVLLLKSGQLLAGGSPVEVMTSPLLSDLFDLPLIIDRHPRSGNPRVSWEKPF